MPDPNPYKNKNEEKKNKKESVVHNSDTYP